MLSPGLFPNIIPITWMNADLHVFKTAKAKCKKTEL